jgi:PucR family transcriptional regulator, purine catabolism regulatory protein
MLTVADALQLKELEGARVLAGHGGLQNVVRWVHNVGVPDAAQWLNGGELVLTTGFNIPDTPESQSDYIQAMADKGVAALALSVGRYIDAVPALMCQAADRLNFPLIEIPYTVRFVDVARTINEQVVQENMSYVARTLNITRVLTQLVLEGGDLRQLAVALAELIGQSISIETERFEGIASHNIAEVDEARRYTLQHGHTDPRLVRALEERGILRQLRRTRRSVFLPPIPEVGLELERILAPIVVHGDIYGYLWIIADARPPSDLERMAIESGATIAALMMLHQEAMQNAEATLKGDLLTELIEGLSERQPILTAAALRYGVDLTRSFALLMVDETHKEATRVVAWLRRVNRALADAKDVHAIVGQFAGQVLLLLQTEERRPLPRRLDPPNLETPLMTLCAQLAANILAQVPSENGSQLAGVRISYSSVMHGVAAVSQAYQQCSQTLHITRRLRDPRRIVAFSELGYLHVLYHAGERALRGNASAALILHLREVGGAELVNTLEAYLDAGGNGVHTAEALHIHRSTLNYRLARIAEVCNVELTDAAMRTNLLIALKLLRLWEAKE